MEQPWPADAVERRAIGSLLPYARNARTHSDAQIEQIAASIKEFGFVMPILVDEAGTIIAGHGRVLAAARLGLGEVPVMVARGWTAAQIAAYRIADNQLALNSGWDNALLKVELADLQGFGFDVALLGFSERDLNALITGTPGLTDPDEVLEPPVVPVAQPGDVWLLGKHRLVCGDATSKSDVAVCLGDVRPHLMVTDPPYGVDYDASWRNDAAQAGYSSMGRGAPGGRAVGKVENDDNADWRQAWRCLTEI